MAIFREKIRPLAGWAQSFSSGKSRKIDGGYDEGMSPLKTPF